MELAIFSVLSFIGAGVSIFSGYRLWILLMPVFALMLPLELAISLSAFVNIANNIIKFIYTEHNIAWKIVLKYGLLSIIAAVFGAFFLVFSLKLPELYHYDFFGTTKSISLIKVLISLTILFHIIGNYNRIIKKLISQSAFSAILLNGFFIGLVGGHVEIESTANSKYKLSKEQILSTGLMISILADFSRILVYHSEIIKSEEVIRFTYLVTIVVSAFWGIFSFRSILKKTNISVIHNLTSIFVTIFAVLLLLGII